MESSGVFDFVVRVKEEPADVLLTENVDYSTISKSPDTENLNQRPQKCDEYRENELDRIHIDFECKQMKLHVDLSLVKKIEDYSSSHLPNINYSDDCENKNTIKVETAGVVKEEFVGNATEELNLKAVDCEPVEENKKRRIANKLSNKHRIKTRIGRANNGRIEPNYSCKICEKNFASKNSLNSHVKSVHHCITYSCDDCGKTFARKDNLKNHIDVVHNGVTHTCIICEKKFTSKNSLNRHVQSVHHCITYSCDDCGKTFKRKDLLKSHIDLVHNGVTQQCKICEKKFTFKSNLNRHVQSVHHCITYSCDDSGKTFTGKYDLKTHIDAVHNRVTHTCEICEKSFVRKQDLNRHVESLHNGVTHACDICDKKYKRKDHLKLHINAMHKGISYACDFCEKNANIHLIFIDMLNHRIIVSSIHVIHAEKRLEKEETSKLTSI